VATIADGQPFVIPNAQGNPTTPSVVAFTAQGGVLVGDEALEQASANVENTLHSAKRFIGRSPKQVADDEGEVAFLCPARPAPLAPEEVCAAVLAQLVADAESRLGTAVRSAVITVPAYYNERQRVATLTAAEIAGLHDVTLLSEPVAACLAYGVGGATGRVLVFDLGAGTFDVSVLSLAPTGDIEVVATSGDAHLGGDDFDVVLVEWLATQAAALGHPVRESRAAMRKVREAAEAAKKQLSVLKSVAVRLPCEAEDEARAARRPHPHAHRTAVLAAAPERERGAASSRRSLTVAPGGSHAHRA